MSKPISSCWKRLVASLAILTAITPTTHGGSIVYEAAVLSKNPLLYWTFDESESAANAASLVNAAPENELAAQGNAGRIASNIGLGKAANFSGGGNFYAADLFGPSVLVVPSQLWAVEFWFNPASSGPQYLSESRRVSSNDPAMIYGYNLAGGDAPAFGFYNSSGNRDTGPLATGQWHHVVVAFYGNNSGFHDNLREIYVNGTLVVSDTTTGFSSGHSLEQFSIGSVVGGGDPFTGLIDEYAIYDIGANYSDFNARRAAVESIAQHYHLAIPEPASLSLLAIGGLLALNRRRF